MSDAIIDAAEGRLSGLSSDDQQRSLHKCPERSHELRGRSTVYGAMIEAGGGRHDGGEADFAINLPRLHDAGANAQDKRLWRVDGFA